MNQVQRRQKVARIRKEQKLTKLAKRPQPRKPMTRKDLESYAVMIESFVESDREVVVDYSAKIQRSKRFGRILSPIFIIWGFASGWDSGFAVAGVVLAIVPWLEYFLYRDGLDFWKQQLEENSEYLQDLKLRLSTVQ
ncbi:MAG: hypothetical protein WC238_00420 [Parcubacteria group bacterium]|jgi:hypothetical protein